MKTMIIIVLAGVLLGLAGSYVGQYCGIGSQLSIDGQLSEWGEDRASPGLVVRSLFEMLGPGLGSAVGIYIAGVMGGKRRSILRFGTTVLGSTLGSSVGWMVSYPLSQVYWILLPALFAAAAGLVAFQLKR